MPAPARRPSTALAGVLTAGLLLLFTAAPVAGVEPTGTQRPQPKQGPQSKQSGACPNATLPPPPVDSSEVPPPGVPSPEPLPIPDEPVGGPRMGECGVIVPAEAPAPPAKVRSATWIVAELGSGDVLAAKNPHGRHRPASTIKVLTALLAIRELDLSEKITITQQDAGMEGSKVGLVPDVTYTVREVLIGLLLQSGNDAAHALARKMGGVEVTVHKMNRLAHELGALDTRAATPSGLDGPGMMTSAYDLAVIFRAAMREPAFAHIVGMRSAQLPGRPGGPPLPVANDNYLVGNYEGAIGGKTGYTNSARHTYIVAAERDGRKLVAVLLRGENNPVDMYDQATALLDYGFRLRHTEPVGALVAAEPEPTASSAPQPMASPSNKQAGTTTGTFGTIETSLTLLTVAAAAVLGVVGLRRRRMRVATAGRDEPHDEHP